MCVCLYFGVLHLLLQLFHFLYFRTSYLVAIMPIKAVWSHRDSSPKQFQGNSIARLMIERRDSLEVITPGTFQWLEIK